MTAQKKTSKNENISASEKAAKTASERLADLFTEAFQRIVNDPKNDIIVDEFECSVVKSVGSSDVTVDVRIFGFAGNTTQDEFCSKKKGCQPVLLKKGAAKVRIVLDDDTPVYFHFSECRNLDATDYLLSYKAV